jgi:HD-GYP domain-containing protein (c-di-GMP phosphodiesterase class II)
MEERIDFLPAGSKDLAWQESETDDGAAIALSTLLSALSAALDLTEGQPMGHAVRTCLIALRLAETLGLSPQEQADLHLSALLKDSGCSSNAARMCAIFGCDDIQAKADSKIQDWCRLSEAVKFAVTHTVPYASALERLRKLGELLRLPGRVMDILSEARCTRGAEIARSLGLSAAAAEAIYHLDEHWDGLGAIAGLRGSAIPLLSRILCLAQTMEVFSTTFGVESALAVARERSGRWFDPELVRAALDLSRDAAFWEAARTGPYELLEAMTTATVRGQSSEAGTDSVCNAFASIVDAKSSFTAEHSSRVAEVAVLISARIGLNASRQRRLYRAGLLHDLGKLAVSNLILDKPGKLDDNEMAAIMQHPLHTEQILKRIPAFDRLTAIAAAHHERLDGSGYHRGVSGDGLDLDMRILAVADVYDALSADRPYRAALSQEKVRSILREESGSRLDPACVEALWS